MTEPTKTDRSLWPFFAAAAVIAIIVAAICWSLAHPYGIHWDEAEYFDNVHVDLQRLLSGSLLKLGGRILVKSFGRPPAYRLLALPFLALFGFHTTVARLISLGCFGLSSWFVYLAASRIGSRVAGAFAVLIFCMSPEVVSASIFFGTDASLYLATSAMLYYVFACWSERPKRTSTWIGLGLAIGLGFLSKTSFIAIGLPVLAFWFAAGHWDRLNVPRLELQRKAGLLAVLVGGPWWLVNVRSAFAYSQYARDFVRNSLGPPSPATWARWFNTVVQCLLGHGLSILIALVLVACLVKVVVRKAAILDRLQVAALGACACAGLPIVLAQLSGTNHLLRHISPAVIPLAIAVGVLADQTGWAHAWAGIAVSSVLFCAQLLMLVTPVVIPNTHPLDLGFVNGSLPWRTMIRFDQWNWRPLRDLSDSCSVETPKISYLGNGREFNLPQIEFPWAGQSASVPDVKWLWRYEDGPLDWQKVMDSADQSDIVLTTPHFTGEARYKEDLDNQYDAEFSDRLLRDQLFRGPIQFEMGRFGPIEVDVFLKKTLVCQSEPQAPASRP